MTEWLTTGQMIDKLKVGEVAKSEGRIKGEFVHRTEGGFYWGDSEKQYSYSDRLVISEVVSQMKWSIIPNYVTFEKAMKAMIQGKNVKFHPEENQWLSAHKDGSMTWFEKFNWRQLFDGKWTIEE